MISKFQFHITMKRNKQQQQQQKWENFKKYFGLASREFFFFFDFSWGGESLLRSVKYLKQIRSEKKIVLSTGRLAKLFNATSRIIL